MENLDFKYQLLAKKLEYINDPEQVKKMRDFEIRRFDF